MQRAIGELRDQFLPKKFNPTGTYTSRVIARARAYRVLAHAEIEHFLEDRVQELALHAIKEWKATNTASRILMALIAFSGRALDEAPESLPTFNPGKPSTHDNSFGLTNRVEACMKSLFYRVKENHGIKEKNVLSLLLAIGFNPDDFDPLWLTTMNLFGEKRGEAAHHSGRNGTVKHPPDPKTEFDLVNDALAGLVAVDEKLTILKN